MDVIAIEFFGLFNSGVKSKVGVKLFRGRKKFKIPHLCNQDDSRLEILEIIVITDQISQIDNRIIRKDGSLERNVQADKSSLFLSYCSSNLIGNFLSKLVCFILKLE